MDNEEKKIWKIRTVKNYPEAHNHICIGEVLDIKNSHVMLNCRTFHFGRNINSLNNIKTGGIGIRNIPWNRIEIVNELESTFDYQKAELKIKNDKVVLWDGKSGYIIASSFDSRY